MKQRKYLIFSIILICFILNIFSFNLSGQDLISLGENDAIATITKDSEKN